jgi:adenosylcobinamide-GDP ribazoletransferase
MNDVQTGTARDRFIYPLLLACALLTRIPVPLARAPEARDFGRSIAFYPAIGALVGSIIAATGLLWLNLPLAPAVAVIFSIAVGLLLTGALHEDGLADTADGLGGGVTREQALFIMRDSRIGSYGTLVLVLALLLRATLMMTTAPSAWFEALVVAHSSARAVAAGILWLLPSARDDGQSSTAKAALRGRHVVFALGIAAGIVSAFGPEVGLFAMSAAALIGMFACFVFWRCLRGVTGDTLGAAAIASELSAMAVYAVKFPNAASAWVIAG